ncbi:MAG: hypothetical protein KGJ07_04585 [Patescibacteria group bacterium]|nr:hypothetical protein [Patescibacteria group bacterium]MDE2590860.1 hypothetical protein [Patescibacteria group bacterium]
MKQKKLLIILCAVLVLLVVIVAGALMFLKNQGGNTNAPVAQQNQVVPTLKPDDIGLTLSIIASGKFANNGVDMKITKVMDIASVDYELAYLSKGDISRGAIGHVDVTSGNAIDQQLPFGTCSDVCHFDTDVHQVQLTLKVTKTDGKAYQVEAPFQMPQ